MSECVRRASTGGDLWGQAQGAIITVGAKHCTEAVKDWRYSKQLLWGGRMQQTVHEVEDAVVLQKPIGVVLAMALGAGVVVGATLPARRGGAARVVDQQLARAVGPIGTRLVRRRHARPAGGAGRRHGRAAGEKGRHAEQQHQRYQQLLSRHHPTVGCSMTPPKSEGLPILNRFSFWNALRNTRACVVVAASQPSLTGLWSVPPTASAAASPASERRRT